MNKMVQQSFKVPELLETDKCRLRMLTVNDVVKDYDAVMSSVGYLQQMKPFGPDSSWPASELTLEQDLIDLGWHQKEFQGKDSFAYTVMSLDEKRCLGCVYFYPSPNTEYDVEITMWVRASESERELDGHLFATVKKWVEEKWSFSNPGYPGREVEWSVWKKIN